MAERSKKQPVTITEGETPKSQKKWVRNANGTELAETEKSHMQNAHGHSKAPAAKSVQSKQPRPTRNASEKPHTISRPLPDDTVTGPTSSKDGNNLPARIDNPMTMTGM